MKLEYSQLLTEYGWQLHSKCICSGGLEWKFRSPELFPYLELRFWPGANKFKIINKGTNTKVQVTSVTKLAQTLIKLKEEYETVT